MLFCEWRGIFYRGDHLLLLLNSAPIPVVPFLFLFRKNSASIPVPVLLYCFVEKNDESCFLNHVTKLFIFFNETLIYLDAAVYQFSAYGVVFRSKIQNGDCNYIIKFSSYSRCSVLILVPKNSAFLPVPLLLLFRGKKMKNHVS